MTMRRMFHSLWVARTTYSSDEKWWRTLPNHTSGSSAHSCDPIARMSYPTCHQDGGRWETCHVDQIRWQQQQQNNLVCGRDGGYQPQLSTRTTHHPSSPLSTTPSPPHPHHPSTPLPHPHPLSTHPHLWNRSDEGGGRVGVAHVPREAEDLDVLRSLARIRHKRRVLRCTVARKHKNEKKKKGG